jgi:hypothetical protein
LSVVVCFFHSPKPPEEPKQEAEWADEPSEVVHLLDDNFEAYIKEHPSVLVMFYAPCKLLHVFLLWAKGFRIKLVPHFNRTVSKLAT